MCHRAYCYPFLDFANYKEGAKNLIVVMENRLLKDKTDETVNLKDASGIKQRYDSIVCVGESLEEYEAGKTHDVVKTRVVPHSRMLQLKALKKVVIAYRQSGLSELVRLQLMKSPEDVCDFIRGVVAELYGQDLVAEKVRIQYGGYVKLLYIKALLEQ